jgi:hypothetical protein
MPINDIIMTSRITESFYQPTSAVHYADEDLSQEPFWLTPSSRHKKMATKTLIGFTQDACNQDNWQRRHPKHWSNADVLDLIYFVATASSGVTLPNLRGEKFQGVCGTDLYHMSKSEYVERDPVYGGLLHDCIQELLIKSDFMPPDDLSPVPLMEQVNAKICSSRLAADVESVHYGQLPKPVEDLMMDDDYPLSNENPPLNHMATVDRQLCHIDDNDVDDSDCPYVRIYGHAYDIDSAADFHQVLRSTNDTEQADNQCVYTDLTTVTPCHQSSQHRGTTELLAAPIDLRVTGHSSRHEIHPYISQLKTRPLHCSNPSAGRRLQSRSGKVCHKITPTDSSKSAAKAKGTKCNVDSGSGGGRHLWEFIRDLLRSVDRGEQSTQAIIRWENRSEGIFRIIDSKQVAQLWGRRKRNTTMTYEKLSRALRWSRTFGFLSSIPKDGRYPKKLCFKFGPLANWMDD